MKPKINTITKVAVFIVILAILIVSAGVYVTDFLHRSSSKLENHMFLLESKTAAMDWEGAEAALVIMESDWDNIKGIWAMLIDHNEIDNIDMALSRLKKYIKARELPMAMAEESALMKLVKHIAEKESFRLENIL